MTRTMYNRMKWLAAGLLAITVTLAHAQVPKTINYQGFLTSSANVPVNNPAQAITFSLYDGANTLLWSETQTVVVTNGVFNVVLGSGTPVSPPGVALSTLPFTTQYFLGVKVGTDPEMTPRQALASSPYAFRAAYLDASTTIAGSQIADGSVAASKLVATQQLPAVACLTNQIAKWNGSAWVCSADAASGTGTVQGQVNACARTLIYIVGKGFMTYLPASGSGPAGNFSFDRVPVGLYSLVAENMYGTQTVSVSVIDQGTTTIPAIQFPSNVVPAGTVIVNFVVDDHINRVYQQGDLQWKGSFGTAADYATSRKIVLDETWSGPYPVLYDDGPWTQCGHEPIGATAGDRVWGLAVAVAPPATGTDNYAYGLIDTSAPYNGAWIWPGNNGGFAIASTQDTAVPVTATGLTFAAFGSTDVQITLDTNALASGSWNTTTVQLKTAHTAFVPHTLTNDGAGHYTFTLSSVAGAGKPFPHNGLASSGEHLEFVFVIGGVEYKDGTGAPNSQGVSAGTKAFGAGSFVSATVSSNPATMNSYIVIP